MESTASHTSSERTPTSDVIVGVAMMVLSLSCALAYIIVLMAIINQPDLKKFTCYRFMLILGIFDMVQCIPHFITGLFTIYQTTWFSCLPKILGVLATPCYVGYTVMTLILAFNRFSKFTSVKGSEKFFAGRQIKIWYGICFICWFFFALALSSPWASIEYVPSKYGWYYNYKLPYSYVVQYVEMVIELGTILISALLYGLIISYHKTHAKCKDHNVEVRILVQAILITGYCTVLNFLWHNSEALLPDSIWTDTILNFMWILNSGVYPLIYVIVNRAIRDSIKTVIVATVHPHKNMFSN